MRPEITVGLDGTPESLSAARWAAHEAELRELPVRLLHLWLFSPVAEQPPPGPEVETAAGHRILRDAESDLREHYPDLPVTTELLPAVTPAALLSAAGAPELLVLGSQGIGTGDGFLIGSLALYTVACSERPVVLVRAYDHPDGTMTPAAQSGPVAVAVSLRSGYDGVLEAAFDAADRRHTSLLAVHATSRRPALTAWQGPPDESVQQADRHALSAALRPWQEKFPGVDVVERLSHESPARAVIDAATGARLLVVGRGGYRTPLAPRIGPVTQAAIHHAPCPLAVIPHD
ncbi:universal stress protein [Streptomyces sp. FH025]|uniref:universal stress protein n=1 Tax=Streptomyces sp. FH025 TaxID=2815937 RepID=UPI001A9E2917|nr:universal stress protein [Streptomyces sp. FH025]MBO1418821.1 universal stress protein [Streptomyces sp. FH025]